MKHSWKTRATALMFSAAAITAGMLTTGCGYFGSALYGPPPVSEVDSSDPLPADSDVEVLYGPLSVDEMDASAAESDEISNPDAAIELNGMTDDDFRHISDDLLIALGIQEHAGTLGDPAFLAVRPDTGTAYFAVAGKSASTDAEAEAIAAERFPDLPVHNITGEDAAGRWRLYEAGENDLNYVLVWDASFLDMETQTLHADVTEETMLLLAAMRWIPGERVLGAFVKDEGSKLTCTEYYLIYSGGDYGLSDTATLYGFTFSADKETGQLTGFDSDQYDFSKEVGIPGTYHPYPDE